MRRMVTRVVVTGMGLLGAGLGLETELVEDGDGVVVVFSSAAGGSDDVEALASCSSVPLLRSSWACSVRSTNARARVGVDLS
jgi:hypothetical protein